MFVRYLRLLWVLLLLEVLLRSRMWTYSTESGGLNILSLERTGSHSALAPILWPVVGRQLLQLVQLILHLCHLTGVDVIVILILRLFLPARIRFVALRAQDGFGDLPLVAHFPQIRKLFARRGFSVRSDRIIVFIPILESYAISHFLI